MEERRVYVLWGWRFPNQFDIMSEKSGQIRTNVRIYPDFHTFLCNFFTFLNACISVKTSPINTKLGDVVNLGVLFPTMWINSC